MNMLETEDAKTFKKLGFNFIVVSAVAVAVAVAVALIIISIYFS